MGRFPLSLGYPIPPAAEETLGGRGLGALRGTCVSASGRPLAASMHPVGRIDKRGSLQILSANLKTWAEEDLNLQGLPHELLRLARLPVSPSALKNSIGETTFPLHGAAVLVMQNYLKFLAVTPSLAECMTNLKEGKVGMNVPLFLWNHIPLKWR